MGDQINVNTTSLTDTVVKNINDMSVQDLATKQDIISDDSKEKLVSVVDEIKTTATNIVQVVNDFDTFLVNLGESFKNMDQDLANKIGAMPSLDTVKIEGGSNDSDKYFTPGDTASEPQTDAEHRAANS
ncbi:hypothetical protein ACVR0S_09135 [Streptococcus dentapri]|uniref:Uncharacterized protein n=1 Tax=Streptococcus dentapri TaxID=573564 RepID=A0ABV8D0J0_9STRE